MLNLSIKSKLPVAEIMRRASDYFIKKHRLVLIETVQHFHGQEGAIEISVSGGRIAGNREYESEKVFAQMTDYIKNTFGLCPMFSLLHMHPSDKDDSGHLLVRINSDIPNEVIVETQEFEKQARQFVAELKNTK